MAKKKIAGLEIKISPELFARIRERVLEEGGPGSTVVQTAERLAPEFPDLSMRTLMEYVSVAQGCSAYLLGLYAKGTISFGILTEICRGSLDQATRDYLGKETVQRQWGRTQIAQVKAYLRPGKHQCSLAQAVMKVSGELPPNERFDDLEKSRRKFEGVVEQAVDLGMKFMTRFKMAQDLIPVSAFDSKGKAHMELFHTLVTLETALENALLFVQNRKKKYLEQVRNHIVTEATVANLRIQKGARNGNADRRDDE